MKKFIRCTILSIAALLLIGPAYGSSAHGLAFGNLTTADACGFGIGYVGGFAGLADNGTTLFGTVTYGFSDYTEGRAKIGFFDADVKNADPELVLGVNFKYEFMDYYDRNRNYPFDLAFGTFLEYLSYESGSVLQLGGESIGSIPFRFESGRRLIPYARLNLRLERVAWDYDGPGGDGSESNFKLGLNAGTKFEMSESFNLYGEFQLDGNDGLFFGVEFRAF